MFTKEYVNAILTPFVGKNIRMRSNGVIPFILETSMESSFQIELNNFGISFVLIDNFYIKRDLLTVFSKAINSTDIYAHSLDKLLKDDVEKEGIEPILFNQLVKYMESNFKPQIAFTYYNMITSLRVEKDRFFLNDTEFFVTRY